jgi:hypothetical protein
VEIFLPGRVKDSTLIDVALLEPENAASTGPGKRISTSNLLGRATPVFDTLDIKLSIVWYAIIVVS